MNNYNFITNNYYLMFNQSLLQVTEAKQAGLGGCNTTACPKPVPTCDHKPVVLNINSHRTLTLDLYMNSKKIQIEI